ncbi:hypothetical protein SDC9_117001 [bioreactor metagenome]|uniref:Uncharacterized protein n=1 Tax=bioreactor metagenome TaxID=1076179 RepID=A0A645BX47_9ZZZZ
MLASDTDNLKQIFLKMRPIANRIYIWGNYNQKIFSMLNGIGFEKQQGSSSRMIMKIFTPGIKIDSSEWFITRIDTDY